ncbi:BadF/BadG/BcrA/BcrD ATPase family protein [Undibacterium sp. TS12]|uniref:BadF/BadG/BcrA/BcrD ATPase family protein n=1 Tax=Undibacterium sp. TS12 TaxID=2908202 RepID=UPI003218DF6D
MSIQDLAHPANPSAAGKVPACSYIIGVDGGGTGTRVVLATPDGKELGRGSAGPSGLVHGRDKAWQSILLATQEAFASASLDMPELSDIALGCGLAGINNVQWAAEFVAINPGFGVVAHETDAYTTLLGAHQGKPGVVVALGTGSVGEVLQPDGQRREVGGWGFPVSDEASGAWLGMRAVNHLQRVLDGRATDNTFARAVLAHCGGDKNAVFSWLAQANQTRYAEIAPIVVRLAGEVDVAADILREAGREVHEMTKALDPSGTLPIALCGGLAAPVMRYLPEELSKRIQLPQADSATGALILVQQCLQQHLHN